MKRRTMKFRAAILASAMAIASTAIAAPKALLVNDFGAKGDSTTLDTAAIQKAIDTAAAKKETVSFKPGTYLTGAIFLKSGVTLDIPVWDWFATRDRVRQSEISRDVARTTLSNTQRKLIATLDEDYAEAAAAHDQLDSLNLSVTTAAESLRLTRLSYSAGETPILEVVDAENSLTAAELAREDGNVRLQTALANLQLLTGTI